MKSKIVNILLGILLVVLAAILGYYCSYGYRAARMVGRGEGFPYSVSSVLSSNRFQQKIFRAQTEKVLVKINDRFVKEELSLYEAEQLTNRLDQYGNPKTKKLTDACRESMEAYAAVREAAEEKDYDRAVEGILAAKDDAPNADDLKAVFDTFKSDYLDQMEEKTLSEESSQNDWESAAERYAAILEKYPNDKELSRRSDKFGKRYEDYVSAQKDALLAADRHFAAERLLEGAIRLRPQNKDLQKQLKQLQNDRPTTLKQLEQVNNAGFRVPEEPLSDEAGNTYAGDTMYYTVLKYGEEGTLELKLNGKYSRLVGTVAAGTETASDSFGMIIFPDATLDRSNALYSTGEMNRSKIVPVDVDLTGRDEIWIYVANTDSWFNDAVIILSDFEFYK